MAYQVRLLDHNRKLLAILDQVSTWSYSRRPSEASELSLVLPRGDDLLALLHIAELLEIWDGSRRRVGGRITGRSISGGQVNVQALTEEILLDQVMTPAQYGRVLDNLDLADLARRLLRGWHPLRVKDASQWAPEANGGRAIEQYRVDITTQPGVVMLAKDPNGAYYSDGYITLRFRASEVPEFTAWDRVRWLSDNGGPVRTTMQYRWGESEDGMGAWSEEFEGALPDTLGIVPGTQDAAIVDIRFSLYTDDTTSEDPGGDPVGQSPWVYAAEILAHTAPVLDGSALPVSTGVTVRGLTADNTSAGEVLREACERAGWEFWVDDGKLYLAEKKGSDRTAEFVLRSGANCVITRLEDSDEGLVNVLTAYGGGDGLDRMLVVLRDEESIQEYGERPGTEEFPAVDLEDLETQARAWLDEHKRPLQSWSLRAVFPFDEEPEYEYGDTVRVVDPESGILETIRIEEETRNYGRAGLTVELRLGTPRRRLIDEVLEEIGEDSPPAQYELRAPQNLRAETAAPGVNVYVNAAEQSRAVGVEIHVSREPNFEPTPGTLAARGNGTRWPLPWLAPGRWYIAARAYDAQGNYSPVVYASAVAGYVGEEILDPELQDDIAFAAAQAAVVEANAAVWGMAAAIADATLLAGTVTSATATTLSDSSHDWAAEGVLPNHLVRVLSGQGTGQVRAIVGVNGDELTVDPAWDVVPAAGDTFEVSSSARITSRETGSIVAKLNADASESEFSSVLQAYNVAQSMVAAFSDVTITTGAVTSATTTSITDSGKDFLAAGVRAGYQVEITSGTEAGKLRVVTDVAATTITFDAPLAQAPVAGDTYRVASPSAMTASTITQRANEIAQVVTALNSDLEDAANQYTAFRQALDEIDLRVVSDEVISAINLSEEGVKIQADRIEFLTQPIPKSIPQGAHLFHFDHGLRSTGGLAPLPGHVATLRPGEGRFGGAVAVEEGTTNLVPSNRLKFEGWTAYSGAQVTLTQNVEFPEIGRNDATRIRTTGGTSTLKYYTGIESSIADQAYTGSVYIKNIGSKPVRFRTQFGPTVIVNPGEWTRAIISGIGNGTTQFQLRFEALNVDDDLDFVAWGPQAERKPFATSFVDGTRAAGKLEYPVIPSGDFTVHLNVSPNIPWGDLTTSNGSREPLIDNIASWGTPGTAGFLLRRNRNYGNVLHLELYAPTVSIDFEYPYTVREWATIDILISGSTASLYIDGQLIGSEVFTRPTSNILKLYRDTTYGYFGRIDELLILPYAASEEEIRSWYVMDAPFYDPAQQLQALDNQIWMDSTGLNMKKVGIQNKLMNLNADRLAWWDGDGEVVAGMGSLDDLITQIDPDPDSGLPRKGLLIAQGAFLATQGVIRDALTDFGVSREKIGEGAIDRSKLSNAAVGFAQLFTEQLSVPDTQAFRNHARKDTDFYPGTDSVWRDYLTTTIDAGDPTEVVKVTYRFYNPGGSDAHLGYRTLINGVVVHSGSQRGVDPWWYTVVANIDTRDISGDLNIKVQYSSDYASARVDYSVVDKNQRYRLTPATPAYHVSTTPSGCSTGCEITCQTTCQDVCQTACQSSCQDTCESSCESTCESSCQSTCEKTAQGCFTDGTPISVYDAESGEVYEIPIETLEPGMLMPYYDPLTDQVKVTECVSNTPSITATLYEITVEGPEGGEPIVIRATPEQPFDVYRRNRVTGEWGWSNMRSASLKPGDRMLRPFDAANRMPAIISVVKLPPQPPTRVWDAKTVTRKYIVAGFADDHFQK